MDKITSNFKKMTLFRLVGAVMGLVIIIGTLTSYAAFEEEGEVVARFSLISSFPIGGVIMFLAALTIIAGIALGNKIISIIGAGVAFAGDIVFPFFMKTEGFYYRMLGLEDVAGAAKETGEDLGEVLGDVYSDAYNAEMDAIAEGIKESFHFKIGFYLILIAAVIALAAFIIDLIRSDKGIEEKVLKQAGQAKAMASSFAENIVDNTVSEHDENAASGAKPLFKRSKEPWVCPNCKETNDGSSAFCVFCGEERPKPRACYNCGTILEDHMMFCPKCGTKYDEEKAKEKMAEKEQKSQKQTCIYCGAELPEGAAFCGKCGKTQSEKTSEEKENVCKYCGAKLPKGAAFCGKCGKAQ